MYTNKYQRENIWNDQRIRKNKHHNTYQHVTLRKMSWEKNERQQANQQDTLNIKHFKNIICKEIMVTKNFN